MTATGDDNRQARLVRISNAMVRLHAREYGKGPSRARTFMLDNFALCLLHDALTTGEHTLASSGQTEAVRANRLLFYRTVEHLFRQEVERLTGRRTAAFLPQVSIDPPVIGLLFLFEAD